MARRRAGAGLCRRQVGVEPARAAEDLTEADVDRAFDDGSILRTHILRPTWHFVAPADIRWMLALTGPRVLAANRSLLPEERAGRQEPRAQPQGDRPRPRRRRAPDARGARGGPGARRPHGRRPAAGLPDDGCGARAGDLQRTASGQAVHLRPPRRARASCAHARRQTRRSPSSPRATSRATGRQRCATSCGGPD